MQLYSKHLGKIPVQVCKENSRQLVELFNAANTDLEQKKHEKIVKISFHSKKLRDFKEFSIFFQTPVPRRLR